MKNQRIGVWPATGITRGILELEQHFGNMVLSKFPKGFMNSWHFDDKQNIKNNYKNTKVNILKNGMSAQYAQQRKPRLTVAFSNNNANQEDAAFGIESPFTYPLVQGVHPELHGYIPIYSDPNKIFIYMSTKRIRINFDVIVEVESLADQEAILNLVENMFKVQYGSYWEYIPAHFILPNDMINTIYKILYFNEIEKLKNITDEKDKEEIYKKIGTEFYTLLEKYSSCNSITRFNRKNNPEDNYFLFKQIYRKIYYEISNKPEKTDGEKMGSIFSKYTVTFGGFFEINKPISYILVTPDVVAGNSVSEVLQASGNINYFRDHNPSAFMKYYGRKEVLPKNIEWDIQNGYEIIYTEEDLTLESPSDTIDIIEWISEGKDKKLKYFCSVMKILDKTEFNDYFHIHIYNNDGTPVDAQDIFWDGESIRVTNIDATKLYTLYVLADRVKTVHLIHTMLHNARENKQTEGSEDE